MDNQPLNSSAHTSLQQQARALAEADQPRAAVLTPEQLLTEPLQANPAGLPQKDAYHCDELLWQQGDGFVQLVYGALLRRQPGDEELAQQRLALESSTRIEWLMGLAASEECQQTGVRLYGAPFSQKLFARSQRGGRLVAKVMRRLGKLIDRVPLNARQQYAAFEATRFSQQQLVEAIQQREQALQKQKDAQLALLHAEVAYHERASEIFRQELVQRLQAEPAANTDQDALQTTVALLGEHQQDKLDAYYIAFEDAFRGERELIRQRIERYLPLVAEAGQASAEPITVVDAGCGRGEWLQLIREQGWQGLGVDLNKVMVQECQAQQLAVTHSDVISYLRTLDADSVTAVTGFHIIEHLPFGVVFALFEESMRVLRPGGIILFETPNPENVLVGSHNFYHDVTHRNPVTPASVEFLARYHGFTAREIIRVNPGAADQRLTGEDDASQRINHHLYGPQDYALLAAKPVAAVRD